MNMLPIERTVIVKLAVVLAVLLAATAVLWLWLRGGDASANRPPAPPAPQQPLRPVPPAAQAVAMHARPQVPATGASSGGSAPVPAAAKVPPRVPMPEVEAPAESLRKVQMALGGGSAQDALRAAQVLQGCMHAARIAEGLHTVRDMAALPEIRKVIEAVGDVTNEQIEHAEREQRRCQVFDPGTLARAGELFRRAHEGGAQGSALSYLVWLNGDGRASGTDPALIATLQAEVRRLAEAADAATLAVIAFGGGGEDLGVTPMQKQAYTEAMLRIGEETSPGSSASSRETLARLAPLLKPAAPLTPQQQKDAQALTQQIVDAWHRKRKGS